MTVEEITAAMNAENFEMTPELRETILNDYKASAEALANAGKNAEQIEALKKERDEVIAERDKIKKEYADKKLSEDFESIMETRSLYSYKHSVGRVDVTDGATLFVKYAMPIISDGDVIGCVASLTSDERCETSTEETEAKLVQTAASFLGRQFEG